MNTGDAPVLSKNNLVTTIGWKINGKVTYALEGNIFVVALDSKVELKELRVDGGASNNDLLMQFQADVLEKEVIRPQTSETTALGAAYLAGLAVGYWSDIDEIKKQWYIDKRFVPVSDERVSGCRRKWKDAVSRSLHWIS